MACGKVKLLLIATLFIVVGVVLNFIFCQLPPLPKLTNTWWGPGSEQLESDEIVPFKISISNATLEDLRNRLKNTRPLVAPLEGIQQQYGINTKLVEEVIDFWKTKYSWREREEFFNQYSHYTTKIQGLKIHFVRIQPSKTTKIKAIPLLLLHGWPGSIRELYGVAEFLSDAQTNEGINFDLIIPSLPGFGFSDGASKPGLGVVETSVIFNNLMQRLGIKKYYIGGLDWGSTIAMRMAVLYPENVLGIHCTMCYVAKPFSIFKLLLGSFWHGLVVKEEHASKIYPLQAKLAFFIKELGYMHFQATKPDTIGVALNDSPVGLAAYILDRFIGLTNIKHLEREDGGLKLKYSYTDLLDNIMIYWLTGSITTSMRYYADNLNLANANLKMDEFPIEVPAACARFPHEVIYQPDTILKDAYLKLVQSTDLPQGGHFSGFEEPKLLAEDIVSAIQKFEVINN